MKQLIDKLTTWVTGKFLLFKQWAIRAAKTQLYALIVFVVFVIATQTYDNRPRLCTIFGLFTIGLVFWWAMVRTGFIKENNQ